MGSTSFSNCGTKNWTQKINRYRPEAVHKNYLLIYGVL